MEMDGEDSRECGDYGLCFFYNNKNCEMCFVFLLAGLRRSQCAVKLFDLSILQIWVGEEERAVVGTYVLYILAEIVKPHPKIVYNKYIFSIFI